MGNAVSALEGATYSGDVNVTEAGLRGMITLRGDLKSVKQAVVNSVAIAPPKARQISLKGENAVAWMSPDELLIVVPYENASEIAEQLSQSLGDAHHLVANVSDARAVFTLSGDGAREVLAKLSPADVSSSTLQVGEVRRTRLGQVAAAFWVLENGNIEVVCFRSVAGYVFDLLVNAAKGGAVGYVN